MGPFITAYLKVNERSAQALAPASTWLSAFDVYLNDAGLGQIAEIFEGDAPHHPAAVLPRPGAWRKCCGPLSRVCSDDNQGRPGETFR
jgi:glycogen debranching enzyme